MSFFDSRAQLLSKNIIICEVISDVEGFRRLRSEWNRLLARSAATSFFLTYEYLWTWWNVYGATYKLRIVTARNLDGKLLGIAPMMIGAGDGAKRRLLRHLVFIGGLGDTLAEEQDFIVAAGHETAIVARFVEVLLEQLTGEWDVMRLDMVDSESRCLPPLCHGIAKTSGTLQCVERHVAPYASLPAAWETYLASRSKSFRTGFKGRAKKLKRSHRVDFLTAGRDISAAEAINIVAKLSHERWGVRNLAFNSKKYRSFHSKLGELLAPQEQAHIVVMMVDGEAAAAGYDLIHGPKVFGFQGGWKTSLARLAIGKIMLGRQIEWAINRGLTEYDFLGGDSGYKTDWATGIRELLDLELVNSRSVRGRTFKTIRQARNALLGSL